MGSTAWPSTARARRWRPRSRPSRGGSTACRWPASSFHRRQPDRRGRHRLVAVAAGLSRGAPFARGRAGRRRHARSRSARPTSSRPPSSSGPTSRPSASTGETIVAAVIDEAGKEVERQEAKADRRRQAARLPVPVPSRAQGRELLPGAAPSPPRRSRRTKRADRRRRRGTSEQTLANNSRLVVVDQGGGPYRVLYVSGRPNWEFKFLRRAIAEDEQVQLVGLLRIARRQPKFDFQATRAPGRTRPLSTASTTPTPTRPSAPTSRSWSASARSTRSSCGTAFPRPPTSCTATTRSSSTTSRPASSPRTSSRSCATS